MAEPVNRTILLLDIEKFGQRDDVEQTFMRRMLHTVVEDTLAAAGAAPTDQHREDRGDSVMVLISPEISKVRLLRALLAETPTLLHGNNRLAASSAQVRLRIVLASGEVALHQQPGTLGGAVGHDLNQAFRLLDAEPLRAALRERAEESVLCVSESVFRGVVRHGHPGLRPEEFHRITAEGKEGPLVGWLYDAARVKAGTGAGAGAEAGAGTGTDTASGTDDAPAAAPPGPRGGGGVVFNGGSPAFGGSLVTGDQHAVSGGQVTGDVVQGTKGGPR